MSAIASASRAGPVGIATAPLLDGVAAAAFLGVSKRTLENWRTKGGGPRYLKLTERLVRYRVADLTLWLAAREFGNTAEEATSAT